ncbi:MAG: J domain-containing protein [Anaerolineae bacterium]
MAGSPGAGGYRVEYTDAGSFSEFFQTIFGGGSPFGGGRMREAGLGSFEDMFAGRRGAAQDVEGTVEISLEEAYFGTTRIVTLDSQRLQVKITQGSRTGTKVRIAGKGAVNRSGQRGDLYLNVVVHDDPDYERDGEDLYYDVLVDMYTLILGGEVELALISGDTVRLKIQPGTQPGQLIRLRGRGMPNVREPDRFGDLYVRVHTEVPTDLSAKERALFRELASIRGYPVRERDRE